MGGRYDTMEAASEINEEEVRGRKRESERRERQMCIFSFLRVLMEQRRQMWSVEGSTVHEKTRE